MNSESAQKRTSPSTDKWTEFWRLGIGGLGSDRSCAAKLLRDLCQGGDLGAGFLTLWAAGASEACLGSQLCTGP